MTVKNVTIMIKILFPNDYSFCVLCGDFNLPNIDWTIPGTDFNDSRKCFLDFCTDSFLTQLIKSPTHKNGNILDLLVCNNFGLDRTISHSVTLSLTNTCDHNLISFEIQIQKVINAKKDTYDFKMEDFENINDYLSNIIGLDYSTSKKISNIFMTSLSAQFKPQLNDLHHLILKFKKVRNIHLT